MLKQRLVSAAQPKLKNIGRRILVFQITTKAPMNTFMKDIQVRYKTLKGIGGTLFLENNLVNQANQTLLLDTCDEFWN